MQRGSTLAIPPILLEGDEPRAAFGRGLPAPVVAPALVPELAQRSADVSPAAQMAAMPSPASPPADASVARFETQSAPKVDPLPATYGTGRLWLTAREPRGLYAHYDPLVDSASTHAVRPSSLRLVLRVYQGEIGGRLVAEAPVPPDSRHCFVQVAQPGAAYAAEMGLYGSDERWQRLAASQPVATPVDKASTQTAVQFASLPFSLKGPGETLPPKEALPRVAFAQLRSPIEPEPAPAVAHAAESSHSPAAMAAPTIAEASILPAPVESANEDSSPTGGETPAREGFWFDVQADLVVYGSASPGASVRIAGQPVPVRADGSFSVRFSLPNG